MKSLTAIIAPPLLCAGVLLGITVEKHRHVQPQDAEAYHARVAAAINEMDFTIGDERSGIWIGTKIEPTKEAVKLLRPNIILSRRYNNEDAGRARAARRCDVLIVHCKDSRDMVGHYPENCYVNLGETLVEKRDRAWQIAGLPTIIGTEYTFERFDRGPAGARRIRRCVYNFLVVPTNKGMVIVRDIKGLNEAAEDYQKRYFGAAQFQFLMTDELKREDRDQIFETLLGSNPGVFQALNSVEVGKK